MPGDVIRRLIEGQDSQRGYVTNTKVMCHLQILGKSKVICDVRSTELNFLEVSMLGLVPCRNQKKLL